ncbi:MAG: RraA family protein [Sedimentisphaerales bacterium]|nr:RraA family protein [Sedimentisphaerales bacterium]
MKKNDSELFSFIRENLRVALVCDILDCLGYKNQAMNPRLRPLNSDIDNCGFVGRARTIQWMQMEHIIDGDPYGLEIDAMDSLKPGDVVVHSAGLGDRCAPWGELMATVAQLNGSVGCVCDGMTRDCMHLKEMNFPVFCTGICPLDSKGRGRVMEFDVPINCGDVLVYSQDIIFADYDGIVVIPQKIIDEVVNLAQEKSEKESLTRTELKKGATLRKVYDTYHIL